METIEDTDVINHEEETWKSIPEFEDYEVSNIGRVRSLDRSHMTKIRGTMTERKIKGVILKSCISKTGYPIVALTKGGVGYTKKVHRLVAEAFIGKQPEGMVCRHLDGNSRNPNVNNLAWGTYLENHADRELHDTLCEGESHYNTDLSELDVVKIRTRFNLGETQNEIASDFNVARSTIGSIIQRKSWEKVAEFSCSYCPEDDKLRIVSTARFSDAVKDAIKGEGFRWAPKQELWVAYWSPSREDLCLDLSGYIGDEDISPEERAIDRAERFAGYRDKRRSEAHGHADNYDAGPSAFGNQNRARAERAAARHERHRGNALSQWSKAEYWQGRTAGVIDHALHKCDARTRRGRILTIEADMRRATEGGRWHQHLQNRLNYENAMLAAEGGQVSEVEMVVGGWIRPASRDVRFGRAHVNAEGYCQILKINKSPATGRVTSVAVNGSDPYLNDHEVRPRTISVERLGEDSYKAPTPEELTAFNAKTKASKAAAKAEAGSTIPLINPTQEDAQALQDLLNTEYASRQKYHGISESKEPEKMTQAEYSVRTKGTYSRYETRTLHAGGKLSRRVSNMWTKEGSDYDAKLGPALCKVRFYSSYPVAVVILTDKPQKPFPAGWNTQPPVTPSPEPAIEQQEAPEPEPAVCNESTELETVAAGCLF